MSVQVPLYSELLVLGGGESEYRQIYIDEYCKEPIVSCDGYIVKFPIHQFAHAFFKNKSRRAKDKLLFSEERAWRILWIKKVLQDNSLTYYAGWDSSKKRYDHTRRVTLVTPDGYVVVIRITNNKTKDASFVTAYLIDDPKVEKKIKASPIWNL
ncbi:hypothetical protein KUV96_01910 [Bacillus velezensis]|uniref:hypothetical protein n=1 Tax=Bacillus TaxID=1386 RepID=UPI000653FC15|nr:MULTISPECIES: hypothetical protein [Bacillus]KMN54687.1 hypothetical protein VK94_12525 [Bacillus sp. LK7]MBY6038968.1 hypothetical protein [Bacillus velezensis]MCA1240389.1 hypothetical protein [Bacillus velezensis]